jgi:hypothetical protein
MVKIDVLEVAGLAGDKLLSFLAVLQGQLLFLER